MEELMEQRHDGSDVITYTDYTAYKQDLRSELERAAEAFVRIGYMLKVARDTRILEGSDMQTSTSLLRKSSDWKKRRYQGLSISMTGSPRTATRRNSGMSTKDTDTPSLR